MIESVYQAVFLTSVRSLIPSLQRIKWMIMEKRRLIDRHCFYIQLVFHLYQSHLLWLIILRHRDTCQIVTILVVFVSLWWESDTF